MTSSTLERAAGPDAPQTSRGTILFVARSLGHGGAERQLMTLATGLQARDVSVHVAQFYEQGEFGRQLREARVPLTSLGKHGRWDVLSFLARLRRLVTDLRPAVVHSYLVEPNWMTTLLKPTLPRTAFVWGVRASDMEFARYGRVAQFSFAMSRPLSRLADLIIANSRAGADFHVQHGYPADRMRVIPNGIDTDYFAPVPDARHIVRSELELPLETPLVGVVGRLDPMKDHRTFLAAASTVHVRHPNVHFICVGRGDSTTTSSLRALAGALGLTAHVHWRDQWSHLPSLYSGLDLLVSSSAFGEGFPNVVAEAMACGTRCVVTDVGDSAFVVAETGYVVPRRDPAALAQAISDAVATAAAAMPRTRIVSNFGIDALVQRTLDALAPFMGARA
ncbi:MAG TPA: glycosyltransferase [Gemmatimonadaceae bacterium]|nr:glycosyltransferase [Gemmatimonadaceae bacterium]